MSKSTWTRYANTQIDFSCWNANFDHVIPLNYEQAWLWYYISAKLPKSNCESLFMYFQSSLALDRFLCLYLISWDLWACFQFKFFTPGCAAPPYYLCRFVDKNWTGVHLWSRRYQKIRIFEFLSIRCGNLAMYRASLGHWTRLGHIWGKLWTRKVGAGSGHFNNP